MGTVSGRLSAVLQLLSSPVSQYTRDTIHSVVCGPTSATNLTGAACLPGVSMAWVDLSKELPGGSNSPARTTPVPFGSDSDYMRMLREAQNETSARTSARVSPYTSTFVSQASTRAPPSPKSPPNSPNVELSDYYDDITSHIFVNRPPTPLGEDIPSFLWSTNSSTSPVPPKNWRLSLQRTSKEREDKWNTRAVASLLLSNLVSLVLGAGLGVWVYRRSTVIQWRS